MNSFLIKTNNFTSEWISKENLDLEMSKLEKISYFNQDLKIQLFKNNSLVKEIRYFFNGEFYEKSKLHA